MTAVTDRADRIQRVLGEARDLDRRCDELLADFEEHRERNPVDPDIPAARPRDREIRYGATVENERRASQTNNGSMTGEWQCYIAKQIDKRAAAIAEGVGQALAEERATHAAELADIRRENASLLLRVVGLEAVAANRPTEERVIDIRSAFGRRAA